MKKLLISIVAGISLLFAAQSCIYETDIDSQCYTCTYTSSYGYYISSRVYCGTPSQVSYSAESWGNYNIYGYYYYDCR